MKGDIIPDGQFLYKYAKPDFLPEDQPEIPFGIFEDESLSCDWAAHQLRPEYSFHIFEGKTVILRIAVCDEIRNPTNPKQSRHKQPALAQIIEHDPVSKGDDPNHPDIENYSHSLIRGKKKILVTSAIARNSEIYKRVNPDDLPNPTELKEKARVMQEPAFKMGPALIISIIVIVILTLIIVLW